MCPDCLPSESFLLEHLSLPGTLVISIPKSTPHPQTVFDLCVPSSSSLQWDPFLEYQLILVKISSSLSYPLWKEEHTDYANEVTTCSLSTFPSFTLTWEATWKRHGSVTQVRIWGLRQRLSSFLRQFFAFQNLSKDLPVQRVVTDRRK